MRLNPLLRKNIRAIVESKRQWIYEKTRHAQKNALPHPPGKDLVNVESALYLGRQYQIEVVQDGLEEIRFEQRFLIPSRLSGECEHVLHNWYMDRAKQWLLENGQMLEEDI